MSSFFVVHVYQIDKLNSIIYNTCSIKLQMLLIRSEIWGIVHKSDPDPRATNTSSGLEIERLQGTS
jgi:hypothetical protein